MTPTRTASFLAAMSCALLVAVGGAAELIPTDGGLTVHDTVLHVTWLADANLAGTTAGRFGVAKIMPNGAMSYPTALQWVAALNAMNGGAGYLGHNNWQLPATPTIDPTCGSKGPSGNSFGANCANSAMGSLFYTSLGFSFPSTAVPIPAGAAGPFTNFQPYLYWSDTASANATQGYATFSFNTGWEGSNVDKHYMYAFPMIKGRLPGSPAPSGNGLQVSADGQTVYDPVADVTWLANADLARTQTFGAQCTNGDGTSCINPDGSMSHTTAENWINGMNAAVYLGHANWQLPPITVGESCGFDCTDNPMGNLYYNQLHLSQGTPAVPTPDVRVGPFSHLQPYLYWTCTAAEGSNVLCQAAPPAPNFGWSFSFGNGFEGTDLMVNDLYVMVYYPDPLPEMRRRSVRH